MARREYIQTSQFTKSQIQNLIDFNETLEIADMLDETDLTAIFIGFKYTLKAAGFITHTNTTAITILVDAVKYMYNDLSEMDTRALKALISQGSDGLTDVLTQMNGNPSWEAVDITYGVIAQDNVKFVSSSDITINMVKINGAWVS